MFRKFVAASVALVVCAGGLFAGEYRGKVKAVDADKYTITITVKKQDRTFNVAKDVKLTHSNKKQQEKLSAEGLKFFSGIVAGGKAPAITVVTEGEGDKEVVKEIRAGKQPAKDGAAPKKPKKPKTDK